MGLVKEMLWEEMTKSIKDIWPYIRAISDQKDLLEKAKEAIETISKEPEDMPEVSIEMIKFLNNKGNYELEELGINDKTITILEVKGLLQRKFSLLSCRRNATVLMS